MIRVSDSLMVDKGFYLVIDKPYVRHVNVEQLSIHCVALDNGHAINDCCHCLLF